jgi:3-hydroxyisobutyrate dehydrogenase-like beta-hydroxyacid dehydrogenase
MLDGTDETIGALELMSKDVSTAVELAHRVDARLPATEVVASLYQRLVDEGRGGDDLSRIIDALA